MINLEKVSDTLFNKIRSRFDGVTLYDNQLKKTEDQDQARYFVFNFTASDNVEYGQITMHLGDDRNLLVYYDMSLDEKMPDDIKPEWYSFLRSLRNFARRNRCSYDVRDITKDGLELRDLKHVKKDQDVFATSDVISEAKLSGTSRSSYENLGPAKIIVRHSKKVDEEILGARSRNIAAIYVENHLGERFRLPEGTSVNEARAYARHVKNGGRIDDQFGNHITKIISEMHSLRTFVRNMRGRQFEDAETQGMVETAIDYYGGLHRDLHTIKGQRGYTRYKESWQPEQEVLADDVNLEELRTRFERRIFDERMSSALPIVARAYKQRRNWAESEFKEWASGVLGEYDEELDEESEAYRHHQRIRAQRGAPNPDYYAALKRLYDKNLNNEISDQELDQERQKLKQKYNVKEQLVVDVEETENISIKKRPSLKERLSQALQESRFDEPLSGYYIVDRKTNTPAHNTPSFKTRDQAQQYLMTKMFANHQNYKVIDIETLSEDLRKWFKEKWVRFGPDGKIRGECARGSEAEGKPKCLPQSKAYSLGKKGRASAAAKKRREDPNPERRGAAKNVATKTNEQELDEKWSEKYKRSINCDNPKGFSQRAHCQGRKKQNESKKKKGAPAYYGYWYPGFGYYANNDQGGEGGGDAGGESIKENVCPACGGLMLEHTALNEKKDACYYKVKSRYKVWPSAYASGALVKCRKKGAKNWGSKKESIQEANLINMLPWPELLDKVSQKLKAMGWNGPSRRDDDTYLFSMRGRHPEEWYMVILNNEGNGWFEYALGTVEEGDPYIGIKDILPVTEASVSMVIDEVKEGFNLEESLGPEQKRVGQLAQDAKIKTGRVIGRPPQKQRGLIGKLVGEKNSEPETPGPLLYELFRTPKKLVEQDLDLANEGGFDKLFQDHEINFTYLNGKYILDSAAEVARAKDLIASYAVNHNKKIKFPKFEVKKDNEITGASTWERSPVSGAK